MIVFEPNESVVLSVFLRANSEPMSMRVAYKQAVESMSQIISSKEKSHNGMLCFQFGTKDIRMMVDTQEITGAMIYEMPASENWRG